MMGWIEGKVRASGLPSGAAGAIIGFVAGLALALPLVTVALILLFLPPLGWILVPLVLLAALALPFLLAGMLATHGGEILWRLPGKGRRVPSLPTAEEPLEGANREPREREDSVSGRAMRGL
jgi:hypothetical protein